MPHTNLVFVPTPSMSQLLITLPAVLPFRLYDTRTERSSRCTVVETGRSFLGGDRLYLDVVDVDDDDLATTTAAADVCAFSRL